MNEITSSNFYDQIAIKIPSPEFVFMNHGYHDADQNLDFESLDSIEKDQSHCVAFIQSLLDGEDLTAKAFLEVGSGRGGNCRYLARRSSAAQILGMEYCQGHVDFCNKNHIYPNLNFVQGDAHALPFSDESFDYVLNMESSHCYNDLDQFLREVKRVLKQDGKMIYTDIIMKDQEEKFTHAIENSGLKLLSHKDITSHIQQSIFNNRSKVEALLLRAIEESLGNRPLIEFIIQGINFTAYEGYSKKLATYQVWKLEKN